MATFFKKSDKSEDVEASTESAVTFSVEQMDEVKASLSTTQDELATLGQEHETLIETQKGSIEEIATLTTSNETLSASVEKLTADLTASQAETVAAEASANAKAIETLATMGHNPIKLESNSNGEDKSITRADFDAMGHIEKNDFLSKGGKLK